MSGNNTSRITGVRKSLKQRNSGLFFAENFCVFPESLTTVFASNLVLGIITLLLLWRLMQTLHISPWISLAMVFLYANFPTAVDMTTMCLTENLFTPLLLGGCYLCIRSSQENGFRLAYSAFFCIVLASTIRAQAFLFLPIQMILLLSDRQKRRAWRLFALRGFAAFCFCTSLAVSPIVLTIACLFYHGLPRYVSSTYPVLFVLAGYHLRIIKDDIRSVWLHRKGHTQRCRPKKMTNWKEGLVIGLWSMFSIVLIYSLCVFSWQVDEEQSAYRLKKYKGISLENVRQSELISSATYESENIPVWNTVDLGDGKHWITWQDHAIIQLQGLDTNDDSASDTNIITRVALDVDGGKLYDFSTVYWLTDDITSWSEDYVYSVPRSSLPLLSANQPELFIDGDVNALLIVPALFRGNEIRINR